MLVVGQTPDDAVRRLWPTSHAFLSAIQDYWGFAGWFQNADHYGLAHAACPCCKSKPLAAASLSRGYPLTVGGAGTGYWLIVGCRCPLEGIAAALSTRSLVAA
jgi:hypothetical protein